MPTPTYCPTCGVPVAPGTQVCGNCGSPVHPTGSYPIVTAAPEPPAGRSGRGRRIVLLVVALGLAAAVAAFLATRAEAAEQVPTAAPDDCGHLSGPVADVTPRDGCGTSR